MGLTDFTTVSGKWGDGAVVLEAIDATLMHFDVKARTTKGLTSTELRLCGLLREAQRMLHSYRTGARQ
jgi:hypothetical protein